MSEATARNGRECAQALWLRRCKATTGVPVELAKPSGRTCVHRGYNANEIARSRALPV